MHQQTIKGEDMMSDVIYVIQTVRLRGIGKKGNFDLRQVEKMMKENGFEMCLHSSLTEETGNHSAITQET